MTDYSKISIDPTEFDKSAYQKALDILENPQTKCFVMAQDIVRGIVPGYHSVEPNIGWANELLERSWPETVRFSTDGQFPQGAVEVKAEGIKNRLQDALSAQSPLIHTNKPVLPEFEYWSSGERYIDGKKNVEALIYCAIEGLDNFPNLAEHVRNNRIPGFEYSPGSPVIKHFREKKHIDFSEHSSVASDYEPHSGEMSYDEREKLNNLLMNDFREVSKKAFHEKGFSDEDYQSVFGKEFAEGDNGMCSIRVALWSMHALNYLDQYKSMNALHEEVRDIADCEMQLHDLSLGHEVKYYIDEKSVHREVESWFTSGRSDNPNADSITDGWEGTVKTAIDGQIPEGAVEVEPVVEGEITSSHGYNSFLNNFDLNLLEYRAEDLNKAVELVWRIDEREASKTTSSPQATFEFASAKDRDQCQEMVDRAVDMARFSADYDINPHSFDSEKYSRALNAMSAGENVKYYIEDPAREVKAFVGQLKHLLPPTDDLTADDFMDWASCNLDLGTIKSAVPSRGEKIPEGAIEVALGDETAKLIGPTFEAKNISKALDVANALKDHSPLDQQLSDTMNAFSFTNVKDWDRVQNMIDRTRGPQGPEL